MRRDVLKNAVLIFVHGANWSVAADEEQEEATKEDVRDKDLNAKPRHLREEE